MTVQVDSNQRQDVASGAEALGRVQTAAMRFVREEAGFAQVFTVNREGYPVGRTMGALINPDWSVDLVQRRVHRRLGQLRRNPRIEVVWAGPPCRDSTNDSPHVYDFGLLIPRVVFLRGSVRFLDADTTVRVFREQTERLRRGGNGRRAPERTDENIRAELVGVHVAAQRVRAEGFGVGAQSYTWTIEEVR